VSLNAALKFRVTSRKGHQDADPPHAPDLLRLRYDRPGRQAADPKNELPSPHSTTLID
jgi:hypothetical protein